MKKMMVLFLAVVSLSLTACSSNTQQEQSSMNPSKAKYKVNFRLPASLRWSLVSVEQDANGYAKSYRSLAARGLSADQSFYINYGHNIKTPLMASMREVVNSLGSTGCKRSNSKIVKITPDTLVFTATADHCTNGRPVSQVFKVFNMTDGQYSIVYSANPNAVSSKVRQEMKNVVTYATISPIDTMVVNTNPINRKPLTKNRR